MNSSLATHEVFNQVPPLIDYNAFDRDIALIEGLRREGAGWAETRAHDFGAVTGSSRVIELGRRANINKPILNTHDRYGNRVDEVEFDPAWHELMRLGMEAQVHSLPWNEPRKGSHAARAVVHYLLTQAEAGVGCPLTMTFSALPALRHEPDAAAEWGPRLTSTIYDSRFIPAAQKSSALMGMAMTEKQGGSDVRANTTRATSLGTNGEYHLTGHKWFCSAPMCDAFLTLAQTDAGITCFLVPRWLPDGSRNRFFIQRLKDKLGNRSNASSEIEYRETWARRIGPEGRGVPTIVEMVTHTRLDCVIGSAAIMRQALAQALHHAKHRSAFGKILSEQPLMQNVLADLAVEVEAAVLTMFRLTRAYDDAGENPVERAFARIATAVSKYWICKRVPAVVGEALECHGGNGYVEDSIMPRLYRESPLASIWEGSGNVMCLDVLRALSKEPETAPAFLHELEGVKGSSPELDALVEKIKSELMISDGLQERARRIVEMMALALQGSLVVRHGSPAVAEAFCASRLKGDRGLAFGTLPHGLQLKSIIERATP